MNYQEIQQLVSHNSQPAVSILLPLYQTSPTDAAQVRPRLSNLRRQAEAQLRLTLTEEASKKMCASLDDLLASVDVGRKACGLALFLGEGTSRVYYLHGAVPEKVQVGESFAVREVLQLLSEQSRYRVLVLSQEVAHLFDGNRDKLTEVTAGAFPLSQSEPGVQVEWTNKMPPNSPHGGIDPDQYRTRLQGEFFHRVAAALTSVGQNESLPLVIAAVEQNQGAFDKACKYASPPLARLLGSFERTPAHELGAQVWKAVSAALAAERDATLQQWEKSIGGEKTAAGLPDVWTAAQNGQVETLLVESGFQFDGAAGEPGPEGTTLAAVDRVIEAVLKTHGQVAFYQPGKLGNHGSIAAVLRYATAEPV